MPVSTLRGPCRALLLLCLTASCQHRLTAAPTPVPPCPRPDVSTAGWTELRAGRGRFTILLPPGAVELPIQCLDSACGYIQVGAWNLSYDRGRLAGRGDTLTTESDVEEASLCAEQVNGRRLLIQTYRVPVTASDADLRGHLVGRVATVASPGSGLYLGVTTRSPDELREFLAAVRTLRVE